MILYFRLGIDRAIISEYVNISFVYILYLLFDFILDKNAMIIAVFVVELSYC